MGKEERQQSTLRRHREGDYAGEFYNNMANDFVSRRVVQHHAVKVRINPNCVAWCRTAPHKREICLSRSQSYDRELQRQRCKFLQRHG
jgi:hypothetical protein